MQHVGGHSNGAPYQAFEKEAAAHGAELRQLPEVAGEAGREALREVVGDGEYFLVHLPDGTQVSAPLCEPPHDYMTCRAVIIMPKSASASKLLL